MSCRVFGGGIYKPGFYGDPNWRPWSDEERAAVKMWGTLSKFGICKYTFFYKKINTVCYSVGLVLVEESHDEFIAHFRKK